MTYMRGCSRTVRETAELGSPCHREQPREAPPCAHPDARERAQGNRLQLLRKCIKVMSLEIETVHLIPPEGCLSSFPAQVRDHSILTGVHE